jgi:hypothetical protein
VEREIFSPTAGEALLIPATGRMSCKRIFAFGLGTARNFDAGTAKTSLTLARESLRKANVTDFRIVAPSSLAFPGAEDLFIAEAARIGDGNITVLVAAADTAATA